MSPLRIKAERDFGITVSAEGAGEALKSNPVTIIKKNGERVEVDHEDHRRFVPVQKGEIVVVPDVRMSTVTVDTHFGLEIVKESSHSSAPEHDQVTMTLERKGTGFGEKPVIIKQLSKQAWAFEKPVPVKINDEEIAEVSWSEE